MKTILLILLFLGISEVGAQDRITVVSSSQNTFIETYEIPSWSTEYSLKKAYRLGPSNLKILKDGIKTAIKWVNLNNNHYKDFEKEICRFKTMEKELFKFHGYVDEFATEMTLKFKGMSDGSFEVEIKQYNDSFSKFISITDIENLKNFKDLLDGKSANKEIDDIFKN